MTAAELDLDAIEQRARRAADERQCWANESGIVDRDVIAGLRRAKELAVDDVPTLVAEVRQLRAKLDNECHQHQAVRNQVDSLVREVRRLQHADRRAVRYALEKDREVAEVDAKLAARDAEIARLNAREAATQVQLHDANGDVEDLRSRLKATSDACNDAENRLHTMTEVARGNKRHVAVLTELLERVEKYADRLANYCAPHGVTARYAAELRAEISRPTEAKRAGASRPTRTDA